MVEGAELGVCCYGKQCGCGAIVGRETSRLVGLDSTCSEGRLSSSRSEHGEKGSWLRRECGRWCEDSGSKTSLIGRNIVGEG